MAQFYRCIKFYNFIATTHCMRHPATYPVRRSQPAQMSDSLQLCVLQDTRLNLHDMLMGPCTIFSFYCLVGDFCGDCMFRRLASVDLYAVLVSYVQEWHSVQAVRCIYGTHGSTFEVFHGSSSVMHQPDRDGSSCSMATNTQHSDDIKSFTLHSMTCIEFQTAIGTGSSWPLDLLDLSAHWDDQNILATWEK